MEMEVCEEVCRLCLNTISDKNYTVIDETIIEVLNVLSLNLDLKKNTSSVMCNACSTKVLEAFQFKATCTNTEDCIFRYVNSEKGPDIDLIEIYVEERDKEHLRNVLGDEKICRLCMQICDHGVTPVKDLETDLTRNYIPEVDFSSTKNSVVCSSCFDALNTHSRFLRYCSDVQNNIVNITESKERPFYIKTEVIEIKSEEDEVGNTSGWEDELCGSQGSQAMHEKITGHHLPIQKETIEVPMYQYNTSSYVTKLNGGFESRQLIHKDKMKIYKCDKCKFESKFKSYLERHQRVHMDNSELQVYNCGRCNYQTKYKKSLVQHQNGHKGISKLEMYKRLHKNLGRGHPEQKDASQVQSYTCGNCSYTTNSEKRFVRHRLTHEKKSNPLTYACEECEYKTKLKRNLKQHQVTHKNVSELQMYSCRRCNYQTKYKGCLLQHQSRHDSISELGTYEHSHKKVMYACDECEYKTKVKGNLILHQVIHKDISELQMYECYTCGYATKHKRQLVHHQLVHKDVSKLRMYNCGRCDYTTKYKQHLVRHRVVHKYDC